LLFVIQSLEHFGVEAQFVLVGALLKVHAGGLIAPDTFAQVEENFLPGSASR
jgi:hypothetical protein